MALITSLMLAAAPFAQDADRAAQITAAKANPFCNDIFDLLKERPKGFASIRGAYRTDDEVWVSLVSLPGARSCEIREWSSSSTELSCSWFMKSGAEAAKTARTLAETTRWCVWYGLDYQTGPIADNAGTPRGRTRFTHQLSMFRPGRDTISTTIKFQAWADASDTRAGVIFTIDLRDYSS